jgi:hypothetical protein
MLSFTATQPFLHMTACIINVSVAEGQNIETAILCEMQRSQLVLLRTAALVCYTAQNASQSRVSLLMYASTGIRRPPGSQVLGSSHPGYAT